MRLEELSRRKNFNNGASINVWLGEHIELRVDSDNILAEICAGFEKCRDVDLLHYAPWRHNVQPENRDNSRCSGINVAGDVRQHQPLSWWRSRENECAVVGALLK